MTEPLRFRRVLVGADGSDAAADALVLARRLVEPDGELVLAAIHERGFRRHRSRAPTARRSPASASPSMPRPPPHAAWPSSPRPSRRT